MEPAVGLILIIAISCVNAVIAWKRGRSAWAFLAYSLVPVLPLVLLASSLSSGDGTIMGWFAFLAPLATFVAAIVVRSGKEMAVVHGSHGDFVSCPFCAEPVRKQAIRCRHCGSDFLSSDA
jgi:hypothetical protein